MSYIPGWVDDPEAVGEVAMLQPMPIFGMTPAGGVPESELPAEVFLWKNYENKTGKKWPSLSQGSIGSCVGFGTVCAIEATLAAQSNRVPNLVQEQIYGGSRVEIGKGRIRNGDGSVGAWAAECARQYGVINRGIHGKYDLSDYSVKLCKEWGNTGIPDDLEPKCREHLVGAITLVRDWASARKALASGYGIAICSNRGFKSARDKDGFAAASGVWNHCMALIGYQTKRPGGFIMNSWGPDYNSGPVGAGDPPSGGFWADDSTIDYMLRQGDSWAFSNVSGFPSRLDWRI
jgi:hypothetical protein